MVGFQKIAVINGVDCDLSEAEIGTAREEYDANALAHNRGVSLTVADLFCFRSLACLTIICLLLRFLMNFSMMSTELMIRDFSFSIYLAGVLVMLPGVLAGALGICTYSFLPRKLVYYACSGVSTLTCILVVALASCPYHTDCDDSTKLAQGIGIIVYKLLVFYSFNLFRIHTSELFPSQIKPIAFQMLSLASSLSLVVVPPVQSFLEKASA